MLTVNELVVHYGKVRALRGISFFVNEGEIISLIGANGAGKTTILHAVSSIVRKSQGSVTFDNVDITGMTPHKIVSLGLVQVPEGRRIFANLTVRANLEMGAYLRKDKAEIKAGMENAFRLFPRLKERIRQIAGTLSGGEQQMLAIARALMSKPRLLLLDEPSMGLAPILVDEIFATIKEINAGGMTILLVEQNAFKSLAISTRAYILETGAVLKEGAAADIAKDEAVREAYLGAG